MRSIITALLALLPTLAFSQCANSVDNRGVQFAVFDNISGFNLGNLWSNFTPEAYKLLQPIYYGVTSQSGYVNDCTHGFIRAYGQGPANGYSCYNRVIFQRGFIVPHQTGTWRLVTQTPDDALMFWNGPYATGGWTRRNANHVRTFNDRPSGNGTIVYSIPVQIGEVTPFVLVMANAQLYFNVKVALYDSSGDLVLGFNDTAASVTNDQVIQYSCDGTTAPLFPDWGHSTK